MGVTAALMAGAAVLSATSQIQAGRSEKNTAEQKARLFEAQAANIQTQKNITARQYRNASAMLEGQAVTRAARQGVKISGSTAQSISQSLTQLGIEESYDQYNLNMQKYQALDQARYQRSQGRQSLTGNLLNAGATALSAGSGIHSKYWKSSPSSSGQMLSGGFDLSNQSLFNSYTMA